MADYRRAVERLAAGETISIRVHGNSMTPKISSGDEITISPDISDVRKGDAVFCKVRGSFYVHLVTAIRGDEYQISNNHGHVNGWTRQVFGKVTSH